ncbi:MAG TPA: VCBS repeat-containing protein, partial [Longimicrobiales bacterium]|nr:VCBS repeat-containing protein [Longimicrobiales bacterium]
MKRASRGTPALALMGAAHARALVAALLAAVSCVPPTTSPSGGASTPGGDALVRRVDAFPVAGADGRRYALPFLGGSNTPRPQWVDVDGDGDLDLVLQEFTNRLMYFERVGDDDGEPRFVFDPDGLSDLEIGEWYRFVDVDADGDPDLLAEEPFSYVRLYRNRGAGAHPAAFELAADTLRDASGRPLFADRQNIPNAGDLDCDGRLDLLIGRTTGTITRYEATSEMRSGDVPTFEHVTDLFEGIEIIGTVGPQLPGRDSRHGANTMALVDFDADGDLDLFWGDFFEAGLLLIENTGSCSDPDLTGTPRPFPLDGPVRTSGFNAPAFGDVDGDGDLDLVVGVLGGSFNANTTTADNLYLLEQGPGGTFELRTRRLLGQLDVGSESIPALLDVDRDGDEDLLVT